MPFTRDERAIIEELLNRMNTLDRRLDTLSNQVEGLANYLDLVGSKVTIGDMSETELKDILRGVVKDIIKGAPVSLHTHENDKEGGSAFAKKGATLIDDTNVENEEQEP